MTGSEYGNTRLRARYARCLDRTAYTTLIGAGGLDQMLGALAIGAYGPDVEAAIARYRGLRRVDEAVRRHLEREYAATLSFYEGSRRRALALVGERWDVRNMIALIRAQASPGGASEIAGWLVPAGRIDAAALTELAGVRGVRALVDLMVAWRLPDHDTANALRRVMPEFDASGDTVALEVALHRSFSRRVEEASRSRPDDAVLEILVAEQAAMAVTVALRLRASRLAGENRVEPSSAVISDVLPTRVLESLVLAAEPDEVIAILASRPLPRTFDAVFARWRRHDDLPLLADELGVAVVRMAQARLRGDPLGLGVPVGYLWVKEVEGRNLRLIARAHVHGLDPGDVEERVVVP